MRIFSKYIWRFPSKENEIYLTFDDGPTQQVTQFVLKELERYDAKATFFCIGKNIKKHPDIYQQLLSNGHTIGNHTQNHLNGWKTKTKKYIQNTYLVENTLQTFNFNTSNLKLFRPPYGKIKKKQAKQILKKGYQIIMWDVLSADFDKTISKEKCLENVIKNTKKGSIIVFHDSIKASEKLYYVLPKVLAYFSSKGYIFKSIEL